MQHTETGLVTTTCHYKHNLFDYTVLQHIRSRYWKKWWVMGQHPLTHDPCDPSNNGDPCDPLTHDPPTHRLPCSVPFCTPLHLRCLYAYNYRFCLNTLPLDLPVAKTESEQNAAVNRAKRWTQIMRLFPVPTSACCVCCSCCYCFANVRRRRDDKCPFPAYLACW